ncbi:MAG: hypothetical protein CVU90_11595 [Firmicutes bacterium HGW-Firmicutes-15]|nr:MAG: hypothetical protein CVU90_11595 [Firmicutes bacterium HGW-Firmicutes-15]
MLKTTSILLSSILIVLLLSAPVLAPTRTGNTSQYASDQVITDIVADYALYTSLLYDIYPLNQYRVSTHANSPDSAIAYLSEGFDKPLASTITACYLQWLPEFNKMSVIPTDSIPIITEADKPYLNIEWQSTNKVLLKRIYTDCYEMGDQYLYLISAEQKGGHWIIIDLQLDCL